MVLTLEVHHNIELFVDEVLLTSIRVKGSQCFRKGPAHITLMSWSGVCMFVCVCVFSWGSIFQVMRSSANWTLNQTLCTGLSVWSLANHPRPLCGTGYGHPSTNVNFTHHRLVLHVPSLLSSIKKFIEFDVFIFNGIYYRLTPNGMLLDGQQWFYQLILF